MRTFAPPAHKVRAVASPRPEAPPVTMKVEPRSSMLFLLVVLLRVLLFGQELRAVAQQRLDVFVLDEEGPAFELFLAHDLGQHALVVLGVLLVLLFLVLG